MEEKSKLLLMVGDLKQEMDSLHTWACEKQGRWYHPPRGSNLEEKAM